MIESAVNKLKLAAPVSGGPANITAFPISDVFLDALSKRDKKASEKFPKLAIEEFIGRPENYPLIFGDVRNKLERDQIARGLCRHLKKLHSKKVAKVALTYDVDSLRGLALEASMETFSASDDFVLAICPTVECVLNSGIKFSRVGAVYLPKGDDDKPFIPTLSGQHLPLPLTREARNFLETSYPKKKKQNIRMEKYREGFERHAEAVGKCEHTARQIRPRDRKFMGRTAKAFGNPPFREGRQVNMHRFYHSRCAAPNQ